MKVPKTPREIGLPHGVWYPQQAEALHWIAESDKRVLFLDAPSATGKTDILGALHHMSMTDTYAVMWSKALQAQAHDMLGAPVVVGRANFQCRDEPMDSCEWAYCDGDAELEAECPFQQQLKAGKKAPLTIFNYAMFLLNIAKIPKRPWVVFDEGHKLEDAMDNWLGVALSKRWFEKIGFTPELPRYTTPTNIFAWAEEAIERPIPHLDKRTAARWRKAKYLALRAFTLLKSAEETRVYERDFTAYVRIIWPMKRFRSVLESVDRVLIMSATLGDIPALANDLGLEPPEYDSLALPSVIPVENRKIYYRPMVSLKKGAKKVDFQGMACGIIDIVRANFLNERGLIHVSSYIMAEQLGKAMREAAGKSLGSRVLVEEKRNIGVRESWASRLDAPILVTPAAGLGIDLPHLFPYQVIAKCPYPDLGDPLVRTRADIDPDWYTRVTARDLVQTVGRVTRNPSDVGATVITDSSFQKNVYERAPGSFPGWFKEALR